MIKDKHRKKILLIEDSEFAQIQIKEALEKFPVELMIINSAEEALAILDRGINIDLMLIDIGLPKMNGVELLEKVNLDYKQYEDTPKIAVTAHVMKTEMDNYIGKGFNRIISKPFRLQQFRDIIVSTLKTSNQHVLSKDVLNV